MANEELSDLAKSVKRLMAKTGKTAGEIATKLERDTAKGLGPVLRKLCALGHAVRNEDGTYSKPAAK